jgi:AcrR family transcriptional regulator
MVSLLSPRERVIQAALHLFYIEGFHAVGTNLICSEAKVNKSTLYHLFPSKVDMILAALEVYSSEVTKEFKKISISKVSAEEKLEQIFLTPFQTNQDLMEKFGNAKGCFVGNTALELAGGEERVRTYLTHVFQVWAEAIEPVIEELALLRKKDSVEGREIDTLKASHSIIAYLQGAILLAKAHNDPQLIKEFSKFASGLLL